jgi:hypothetical protein
MSRMTRRLWIKAAAPVPATKLAPLTVALLVAVLVGTGRPPAQADEPAANAAETPAERMAAQGFIRYRGAWRTAQEIELIERDEAANVASKQWVGRLERLRRSLDAKATAARAADEIRGISDPHALAALAAALKTEPLFQVRTWYLEAMARIRTPDSMMAIVAAALDHPDRETRIAATERLVLIGPHQAVPILVSALASADNAQVNRAAEALGRLGVPAAIGPLIGALETNHLVVAGGVPAGSTSATFTPSGGGLSMGGGPKPKLVPVRNDRVLEALVALTGVNFEWDAVAWRAWLVNERALPPDFDPRRS